MNTRRSLERYVEPEITEARIARQWAGTEERMAKVRHAWGRLPVLAAAATASIVLLVLFVHARSKPAPITEGALLESAGPQTITLNDGSRVDLAPDSRLHVNALESKRIDLALEQGSAVFDVRHIADRRFVVEVGRFDIVDVGTRFGIDLSGAGAIAVHVEQGSVRIERRDSSEPARFLSAGERWSTSTDETPPAPSSNAATEPPASSVPSATEPSAAPPVAPSPAPRAPAASPKDLLEGAQRAQRAGHLRDAATQYDRLRRDFRTDGRAGVAAFELGRLRLGPLGDQRGAAEAFRDAIALSPNATFREDAEAHLVEALDGAGDVARCESARTTYLADYPHGLHVTSVSARCARTP